MKKGILASIIIIGGVLASSVAQADVAQADSAFSLKDLNVIYSGLNPSWTRDLDVSNYYTTPAILKNVTAKNKITCHWSAVKNTPDSIPDTSHAEGSIESYYQASQYMQRACKQYS